ncbi:MULTISPECIES: DUF1289 domain-containing protein [Ramlibacter]|uniref:DUF1289 domain-containing protein n=1 Tax=Ramlibacter pinisoli TaxID=2682844 RepID=A0A6N8J1F1_9BURK|nr:DUF1289 domain-containing protein [Ramlibacter sp. CGMCC 1.13660]MVQ32642.1 DUF1289 domain-containing protein [Ramlibacter pinisoli]
MSPAARHIRRQWPRLADLPPGAPVPSPCNNVCRIDDATGLCQGCLRTLEEIGAWSTLSDAHRREVWRGLRARADGAATPEDA